MTVMKNMLKKLLRIILVVIVLLAAIPVYIICLLQLSGFLEKNDPMSKYQRAEKITEETYAELSEIDTIYADLPDDVSVGEVYRYFDGWRSEYVVVYLNVPEDTKEEFVKEMEARDVREISEESVYNATVSSEDPDKVSISYLIHNGYHDFGVMVSDHSYQPVYVVFGIVYAAGIIALILFLILGGRKRR